MIKRFKDYIKESIEIEDEIFNEFLNEDIDLQDDNSYKIKLMFITDTGAEWLDDEVNVSLDNFKDVIKKYYDKNKNKTDELESKWKKNGEKTLLSLNVVKVTSIPNDLWGSIYREVDKY